MQRLDDILIPATDRPILWLDAAAMAPLAVVLMILLPGWVQTGETYLTDVSGQMSSPLMLIALGMAVAFRVGAIDLSGWMIAAAGGLVAAGLIGQGLSPMVAFAVAAGVGAAIGAVNGLLVVAGRLPSLIVTAGVAGLAWGAMALLPMDQLTVPDRTFGHWLILLPARNAEGGIPESLPLGVTRMIIVLGAFSLVIAALVAGKHTRVSLARQRWSALAASGALAGVAGACGLLDHSRAVVPSLPVNDLRPPAAALLAGALLLAGPGRTPVAALLIPIALLGATIWRQAIPLGAAGVEWQTLLLIGLGALATIAVRMARRRVVSESGGGGGRRR